jgi:hypothetical protein
MRVKSLRWLILAIIAIALLICSGSLGRMVAQESGTLEPFVAVVAKAREIPNAEQIVATINGRPITRGQVQLFIELLRAQDPTRAEDELKREAFAQVLEHVVALQAAEARGIAVSDAEAEEAAKETREALQKLPPNEYQQVLAVIKAQAKNEDEYWRNIIEGYRELIMISKLRKQLYAEVPTPTLEEAEAYLQTSSIEWKSHIILIPVRFTDYDIARQAYEELLQKWATEGYAHFTIQLVELARQYNNLAPDELPHKIFEYADLSELPPYVQEAVTRSAEQLLLIKCEEEPAYYVVFVLSERKGSFEEALEYARHELHRERQKQHYEAFIKGLKEQAVIEILAPEFLPEQLTK